MEEDLSREFGQETMPDMSRSFPPCTRAVTSYVCVKGLAVTLFSVMTIGNTLSTASHVTVPCLPVRLLISCSDRSFTRVSGLMPVSAMIFFAVGSPMPKI